MFENVWQAIEDFGVLYVIANLPTQIKLSRSRRRNAIRLDPLGSGSLSSTCQ